MHSGSRGRVFEVNPEAYGGAPVESYTVVDVFSRPAVGPETLNVRVESLLNVQYFLLVSQLEAQ